jgi:hypothetical protein
MGSGYSITIFLRKLLTALWQVIIGKATSSQDHPFFAGNVLILRSGHEEIGD